MDSNTNFLKLDRFFSIFNYYRKNFTDYCLNNMGNVRIHLLFDLLIGTAYNSAQTINQIDDNTIEITGDADSLLSLYDRLLGFPDLIKVECSVKREDLIPQLVTNPIERFIIEKGTSMIKDLSKYTIQFHKIQ